MLVLYTLSLTQSPPSLWPDPLLRHAAGSTPSDPDAEPEGARCAGVKAVPYARFAVVASVVCHILFTKAGVGIKFLPPPNVGHSRVRKSWRCAATRPVAWILACSGPAMINVIRSIAKGIHCAGIVITKKVAFCPRSSWQAVYAKANTSAEVNIMPPVTNTLRPYGLLDNVRLSCEAD